MGYVYQFKKILYEHMMGVVNSHRVFTIINTYDWGFLSVTVFFQVWCSRIVWTRVLPFFVGPLRGESLAFLGVMGHLVQVESLKWSHQETGLQAAFGSFCSQASGCSLPHCPRWSEMLLLLPGGS
jgi:hypothetical protein